MTVAEENIKSGSTKEVLMSIRNLKTYYPILGGIFKRTIGEVKAVDGVTFNIYKGETLGLVGESGCGKTTIGNTILNLVPATSGDILYQGVKIVKSSRSLRKKKVEEGLVDTTEVMQFTKNLRKKIQIFKPKVENRKYYWRTITHLRSDEKTK